MSLLASLNDVSLSYGDNEIFSEVTFHVREGERIGVIGANGVGKSTLLRLLIDVEQPESGSVTRKKELRMGIVPQSPEFPEAHTVTQVVQTVAHIGPGAALGAGNAKIIAVGGGCSVWRIQIENRALIQDIRAGVSIVADGIQDRLIQAAGTRRAPGANRQKERRPDPAGNG